MTIFICGDSTAATYAPAHAPLTGWGQLLPEELPGVRVVNRAIAGRSTRTFLAEGRLAEVEEMLQPGDLLLIQFGHNDAGDKPERHTEPHTTFADNLSVFVETARARGAVPVLMTPIPINQWAEGRPAGDHGEYAVAIRQVAARKQAALLDITQAGMAALQEMGQSAASNLYMNLRPGLYPAYSDGRQDNVHTQHAGAALYARLTVEALRAQRLV